MNPEYLNFLASKAVRAKECGLAAVPALAAGLQEPGRNRSAGRFLVCRRMKVAWWSDFFACAGFAALLVPFVLYVMMWHASH